MFNLAVVIRKIDNVHGYIDTEDFDFFILIQDYLSFFSDGYKFHPAYKNKQWDGKIRLIQSNGQFPLGLCNTIKEFCLRHDKTCYVDPDIRTFNLDRGVFNKFVEELNIHIDGEKISPYDYQMDASYDSLVNARKLLLSPTSSGKTIVQYILLRFYQKMFPDDKLLIIVPTTGLVHQMRDDFADYASETDWNVDDYITCVSKGKMNEVDKQVIITTYQSLNNVKTKPEPEFFHQFKILMVDEVHTATSNSVKYIAENCINAEFRTGLTGTLDECKTNEMVLRGMFGDIMDVTTTKELMDAGTVAQLKINCLMFKYPDKICSFMRSSDRGEVHKTGEKKGKPKKTKCTYPEEISYLIKSPDRNRYIMRLAASLQGNSIIMIKEIEHGENLYKWMKQVLPDRDIYLYNGSVGSEERDIIKNVMETKENAIIIGSLGTISTGISIKRLHNMIFAHPSKSRIKVLQSVGRLLRKSKFGNFVNMIDIIDDFSIGAYENYVLTHGRKRVQYYNDQQFEYDVKVINLE